MANVSYDTLTIEINADSGKASRSINALSKSLLKLEDTAKKLDWEQLKVAKKYLEDVANISFDNVSKGLQDVVSAFKSMNKEAEKYGKKGVLKDEPYNPNFTMKDQMPSVVRPNWQSVNYREIDMPRPNFEFAEERHLPAVLEEVQDIIEVDSKMLDDLQLKLRGLVDENLANKLYSVFENFKQGIVDSTLNINLLKQELNNIIALEKIGDQDKGRLSGLRDILSVLTTIGQQAKIAEKNVADLEKQGDEKEDSSDKGGGKSMGKLQKLFNSIKRIALYRLIRRVIQLIAKAIKEGIENIARFDKEFNKSMSNIKSAVTYLKNAIGSAFAPIIEMLEPFITGLIMQFAELFNKIGEISSAMAGKDMFTKAKYKAEDFAKSLAKVSLGIDELNVIQQNGVSFEQAEVSDDAKEKAELIKGIMSAIKEIVDTLMPLVKTIFGSAKDFIEKLLPRIKPLLQAINKILTPIVNLVNLLIENTHELVEDSLISLVEAVTTIFDFIGEIVQSLMPVLVPIIELISSVLNVINRLIKWVLDFIKQIIDKLGFVKYILTAFATIIGIIINAVASLIGFLEAIYGVMNNIVNLQWDRIPADWEKAMSNISNSWSVDFVGSIQQTPMVRDASDYSYGTPANVSSDGSTQVNVYIDSQEVAKRVNQINENRGANTLKRGTLTYAK